MFKYRLLKLRVRELPYTNKIQWYHLTCDQTNKDASFAFNYFNSN